MPVVKTDDGVDIFYEIHTAETFRQSARVHAETRRESRGNGAAGGAEGVPYGSSAWGVDPPADISGGPALAPSGTLARGVLGGEEGTGGEGASPLDRRTSHRIVLISGLGADRHMWHRQLLGLLGPSVDSRLPPVRFPPAGAHGVPPRAPGLPGPPGPPRRFRRTRGMFPGIPRRDG